MSTIQSLKELKNRVQATLTSRNLVKFCLICGLVLFLTSLLTGVVVANILDPAYDGYDIIRNYISDLGSFKYTAIPHFLDFAAIITSILLIPVVLYFKKTLCTYQKVKEESLFKKIPKLFLSNFALVSMFIALIGFAGIGFFSEDLSAHICDYYGINPFEDTVFKNFHYFFSIVVFTGFIFSGFFIGLYFIFFSKSIAEKLELEKYWGLFIIIGLEMLIWPPIHGVSFILELPPSEPFHEWFMLFSIFAWIIPSLLLLLRRILRRSERKQGKSDMGIPSKIYAFLVNPQVIKYSITIGTTIFISTIIAGYIIAQFDLPGYTFDLNLLVLPDPAGFNIIQDYFSNLGSYRFTPIPQFLNLGLICSSVLLAPSGFYLFDMYTSDRNNQEISDKKQNNIKDVLTGAFLVSWILGLIGLFGIGVFSEDVAEYVANITGPVIFNFNWHHIFAGMIFIFFISAGISLALLFLLYPEKIAIKGGLKNSKILIYVLSFEMVVIVPITYIIGILTLDPFWEWMYFIAICVWIFPFLLILYRSSSPRIRK